MLTFKINFYLILFLLLSMSHCQRLLGELPNVINPEENREPFFNIDACINNRDYLTISNRDCFNNISIFNQKKYQINNFAKNLNEDFTIQFSENSNYDELSSFRLFYGLTNKGRYLFKNESSYSNEFNINIDEDTFYDNEFYWTNPIENSKNLFVSLRNKENKYLFSINSYNSMVELYDLNNDNNNYIIWSFHEFFKLNPDDYFFLFDYELFEIKDRNEYVIAFIPQMNIDEDILDVTFIKRFRFQSFDINAFEDRGSLTYQDYLYAKILNVFLMDDLNTIVVLSVNETEEEENNFPTKRALDNTRIKRFTDSEKYYKFNLKFYNPNLKSLLNKKEVKLSFELKDNYDEDTDIYIKSLYLNIFGEPYVIFVYSYDDYYSFVFDLFDINYNYFRENEITLETKEYPYLLKIDNDGYYFESTNEFVKIKDTQVAFMCISRQYSAKLTIVLIDLSIKIFKITSA